MVQQFGPQRAYFQWIAPDEQRRITLCYALRDQPIGWSVRMCPGVTKAGYIAVGPDDNTRYSPMRQPMSAVGNAPARYRRVQDECFYRCDLHGAADRENENMFAR